VASAPAEASPYWVVASQALGSGDLTWTEIPAKSLGVFVPGEQPAFYEIEQGSGPEFWMDAITVETVIDEDGDGWASRFRVCCDPNVEFGSYCVSLRLVAYMDDAEHAAEGPTRCRWITEDLVDEHCIEMPVSPDDLPPSTWDVHLELHDRDQPGDPVAVATPETDPFSGLGGIKVEGSEYDTIPNLPRRVLFEWVERDQEIDLDEDGYVRSFRLRWDADMTDAEDSAQVYVKLWAEEGAETIDLGSGETYWVRGQQADTASMTVQVTPDARPPSSWDLIMELFDAAADPETLLVAVDADSFSVLSQVPVEGPTSDEVPDPNRAVGTPQPNPGHGSLSIPVRVPPGGAKTGLEVWDSSGRLIWKDENGWTAGGEQELHWDGYDLNGARASAGAYFCRVRIGEEAWERRFTLLR
jgi:hypothetical protein